MLGESICISRATAATLYFNCFLILLPICKSLLSWIRLLIQKHIKSVHRRLFNHNQSFHAIIGITIMILSVAHTLSHCVNCYRFYINFSHEAPELNISKSKKEISIAMLLTKCKFNLRKIRRSRYEIFFYSHHLSILFLGLLIVHGFAGIVKHQDNTDKHYPGCEYDVRINSTGHLPNAKPCSEKITFSPDLPQAWKWLIVPLLIYAIEKLMRYWSGRKPVQFTKAIFYPGDVIELRMRKPRFSAMPGQYIRMNCPVISRMQWHPFTLTECPSEYNDEFAVHIKLLGNWTNLLASQLKSLIIANENAATRVGDSFMISMEDLSTTNAVTTVPMQDSMLTVYVDGPYGSPFQDISRFSVAVVITAGIGVTPFASVLNQIRSTIKHTKSYGKLKRLYFIWVCKTHDDLSWFLDILYRISKEMNDGLDDEVFTTNLFLTRATQLSETDPSFFDERKQWLSRKVQYKRPNWKKEFSKIEDQHQSQRIGVFFCGPKAIHPALHRLCNKEYQNKNTFVFHKENF
eukprot:gene307-937_t